MCRRQRVTVAKGEIGTGRKQGGKQRDSQEAAADLSTWEVLKRAQGKTAEPERAKNVTKATDVLSAFLINFL